MISAEFTRDGKLLETEFKRSVIDAAALYAALFALVSGTGLTLLLANMDKVVSWIIFALGIAIFIGAVGGIALYKYNKFKRESAAQSISSTVKLDDGGVTVLSGENEKTFEYKDFYKYISTRDYAFLYMNKYEFLTLPKAAFEEFSLADALLKERVGKS